MLREEVLRVWEELKMDVIELDLERRDYGMSFVIEDKMFKLERHPKNRKLIGLGIPKQIVANQLKFVLNFRDPETNIEIQSESKLSYNFLGKTYSASSMVVLLWGEIKKVSFSELIEQSKIYS